MKYQFKKMFYNIFVVSILLTTLQYTFRTDGKECVLRKSGACKVLNITDVIIPLSIHDFGEIVPQGFLVKTTMEINFFENKYSFSNNLPDERKIPITYSYDYPAPVKVVINGEDKSSSLKIKLGYVKRRLATLVYKDGCKKLIKHNHYTPILPTFPFILHFEITTNGSFSVYADSNTEPFFHIERLKTITDKKKCTSNETTYKDFIPKNFEIYSYIYNNLIGLYDCSQKNKPNGGTHYVDRLYDCRQEFKGGRNSHGFRSLKKFQETYSNDVLFDEYIVADSEYLRIHFYDDENPKKYFYIGFKVSLEIALHNQQNTTKISRTGVWVEQPSRPYFIHVLITNGSDNNYIQISNIRGDSILKLNLCGQYSVLTKMEVSRFAGAIYMDCLIHPPDDSSHRQTKFDLYDKNEISVGLTYHDNGLNFTRSYLDMRKYIDENTPFLTYEYDFGVSLDDWCEGDEHLPKLYVKSMKIDESKVLSDTDLSGHVNDTSNILNVSAVNALKDLLKYFTQK